ncbi:MAG: Zn-dependent alcohol dehydrogenase [Planctomycetota bacterium]|nr:Zn-dependent alcohol dehydrogenase [Planctomycetota bacterium]
MKTRAAVLFAPHEPFRIETLDLQPPKSREVLVKLQAAGVCHSDWHIATGDTKHPLPAVCGHEGSGIVEAVGEGVASVKPGERVALNWAPNCGSCFYCAHGRPALCEAYRGLIWQGVLMDGTPRLSLGGKPVYHYCALACFSEYAVVPEASCVKLGVETEPRIAALVGCAVSTGVGAAVNTVEIPAGASVAVLGAGGIGSCVVLGARLRGAGTVVVVDRAKEKMKLALELGATHALEAGPESPRRIRELTGGRGADFVFEAVGVPAVQEQALECVRPGGTLVLVGLAPMGTSTQLPGAIITRRELTVRGCYYGTCEPARDFPRFARWHAEGKLPLEKLVTRTYALDEINAAYADLLAGKLARGVIVF